MTFMVNGAQILVLPLRHHWVKRAELDRDGFNKPIYPGILSYEMFWPAMTPAQYDAWQDVYLSTSTTGSCSVTLPEYGVSTYQFKTYSGASVDHPEYDDFFQEHYTNVRVLINNIVP